MPEQRPDAPQTPERPKLTTKLTTEIPGALPNPMAARSWARDVQSGALIRRWSQMARAARTAADLTYLDMSNAARADGMQSSENRIWRVENAKARNELDIFLLGWILARGGYTMPDWYPPLAGPTDGTLSDDERELVRTYRAAPAARRPELLHIVETLSKSAFGSEHTPPLPENVVALPPERHKRERNTGERQKRLPRKMYGNGGA